MSVIPLRTIPAKITCDFFVLKCQVSFQCLCSLATQPPGDWLAPAFLLIFFSLGVSTTMVLRFSFYLVGCSFITAFAHCFLHVLFNIEFFSVFCFRSSSFLTLNIILFFKISFIDPTVYKFPLQFLIQSFWSLDRNTGCLQYS